MMTLKVSLLFAILFVSINVLSAFSLSGLFSSDQEYADNVNGHNLKREVPTSPCAPQPDSIPADNTQQTETSAGSTNSNSDATTVQSTVSSAASTNGGEQSTSNSQTTTGSSTSTDANSDGTTEQSSGMSSGTTNAGEQSTSDSQTTGASTSTNTNSDATTSQSSGTSSGTTESGGQTTANSEATTGVSTSSNANSDGTTEQSSGTTGSQTTASGEQSTTNSKTSDMPKTTEANKQTTSESSQTVDDSNTTNEDAKNEIAKKIAEYVQIPTDLLNKFMNNLGSQVKSVTGKVGEMAQAIGGVGGQIAGKAVTAVMDLAGKVTNMASNLVVKPIQAAMQTIFGSLSNKFNDAVSRVQQLENCAKQQGKSANLPEDPLGQISSCMDDKANEVANAMAGVGNVIGDTTAFISSLPSDMHKCCQEIVQLFGLVRGTACFTSFGTKVALTSANIGLKFASAGTGAANTLVAAGSNIGTCVNNKLMKISQDYIDAGVKISDCGSM